MFLTLKEPRMLYSETLRLILIVETIHLLRLGGLIPSLVKTLMYAV